ncbi:MAG: hypothetical protein ACF8MJ_01060 [Phycisphaerales bacterium JB050]
MSTLTPKNLNTLLDMMPQKAQIAAIRAYRQSADGRPTMQNVRDAARCMKTRIASVAALCGWAIDSHTGEWVRLDFVLDPDDMTAMPPLVDFTSATYPAAILWGICEGPIKVPFIRPYTDEQKQRLDEISRLVNERSDSQEGCLANPNPGSRE